MSHSVLVKNLHKEKKYDVFFPYFKNMGIFSIQDWIDTADFDLQKGLWHSFKGFMTIALHFQAQVKIFWKEVLIHLKDRDFK